MHAASKIAECACQCYNVTRFGGVTKPGMSDERSERFQATMTTRIGSLLEAFDRVVASLPLGDPIRRDLLAFRPRLPRRRR